MLIPIHSSHLAGFAVYIVLANLDYADKEQDQTDHGLDMARV